MRMSAYAVVLTFLKKVINSLTLSDLLKERTNEERRILHDDVESAATSLARSSA